MSALPTRSGDLDTRFGPRRGALITSAVAHRCGASYQRVDPEASFFVANIKSQIKRNRTNEKARQRNKAVRSSLKTSVRKFREAAATGDSEGASTLMRQASRALDKAASKGVIHANAAANKKSARAQAINKI
jgi:small subunit ribosomal protein S20